MIMDKNTDRSLIRIITYVLVLAGIVLHMETALIESSTADLMSAGLFLWSTLPYALIFFLRRFRYGSLCAVLTVLIFDVWTYLRVFVFTGASTDAIALMFVPLWNIIVVIPLSYFIGSVINKRTSKNRTDPKV